MDTGVYTSAQFVVAFHMLKKYNFLRSLFLLSVASFTSKTQISMKFDTQNFYHSSSRFDVLS